MAANDLPDLTPEEKRNGWTPETLARYVAERERAATAVILRRPNPQQAKADGAYDPHRW